MIDAATGAGTVQALRRDVALEQSWPDSSDRSFVLVVVKMQPVVDGPLQPDPDTVEIMLRTLVEAAPLALAPRDRVYRSGWRELTLFFRATDLEDAQAAIRALAASVQPLLSRRRLPAARLMMRLLDPEVVLSKVKPSDSDPDARPAARRAGSGSHLTAAI